MLEAVAGDARQPVVGVEGVDVREADEVLADAVGEVVDDVRELLLGEVGGPGLDVDHPEPRLHLDDLGAGLVATAGEDVGAHAGLGQRRHQLADVDVHAPAVALPGLGERRGVQREDGETAHGRGPEGGQRSASTSSSSVAPEPISFSWRNDV